MLTSCSDCGLNYDDARCFTLCPHEEFLTEAEAAQKDAAIALVGRRVRFRDQPNGKSFRVLAIGYTGMVTLEEMVGEFAPHLFVLAP